MRIMAPLTLPFPLPLMAPEPAPVPALGPQSPSQGRQLRGGGELRVKISIQNFKQFPHQSLGPPPPSTQCPNWGEKYKIKAYNMLYMVWLINVSSQNINQISFDVFHT